ncbi:protein contains FOG: TPR repeat [Candidatus Brocadia sinica JPN1]|uniref:Protein contains FOG: TPR repeat n=1 Tax=Candidatus Brocadia sinica JPN1 TaxID=1197129 RepID=A0ABQ0K1B4_9BACT|nr:protein contains FOG: TPR repeat [Candidatus Brocadia sinica JPN1]
MPTFLPEYRGLQIPLKAGRRSPPLAKLGGLIPYKKYFNIFSKNIFIKNRNTR